MIEQLRPPNRSQVIVTKRSVVPALQELHALGKLRLLDRRGMVRELRSQVLDEHEL